MSGIRERVAPIGKVFMVFLTATTYTIGPEYASILTKPSNEEFTHERVKGFWISIKSRVGTARGTLPGTTESELPELDEAWIASNPDVLPAEDPREVELEPEEFRVWELLEAWFEDRMLKRLKAL